MWWRLHHLWEWQRSRHFICRKTYFQVWCFYLIRNQSISLRFWVNIFNHNVFIPTLSASALLPTFAIFFALRQFWLTIFASYILTGVHFANSCLSRLLIFRFHRVLIIFLQLICYIRHLYQWSLINWLWTLLGSCAGILARRRHHLRR